MAKRCGDNLSDQLLVAIWAMPDTSFSNLASLTKKNYVAAPRIAEGEAW